MPTGLARIRPVCLRHIGPDARSTRLLEISNLKDKFVQGMTHKVMAAIDEPIFLD
jgi:hypothetical protein